MKNLDWMDDMACKTMHPETFFTSTAGPAAHRDESRALAVCAKCPVVEHCNDYTANDQYGVSGGRVRDRKSGSYRSHATAVGRRRTA